MDAPATLRQISAVGSVYIIDGTMVPYSVGYGTYAFDVVASHPTNVYVEDGDDHPWCTVSQTCDSGTTQVVDGRTYCHGFMQLTVGAGCVAGDVLGLWCLNHGQMSGENRFYFHQECSESPPPPAPPPAPPPSPPPPSPPVCLPETHADVQCDSSDLLFEVGNSATYSYGENHATSETLTQAECRSSCHSSNASYYSLYTPTGNPCSCYSSCSQLAKTGWVSGSACPDVQ